MKNLIKVIKNFIKKKLKSYLYFIELNLKLKNVNKNPIDFFQEELSKDCYLFFKEEMKSSSIFFKEDDIKNDICTNYLEGLEWTMKYYSDKCIDWRWTYKYNYPPLFKDLLKYTPIFGTTMIEENDHKAVDPIVQLSYVLPESSLYILPNNIYKELCLERLYCYPNDAMFSWAFCKYMWEAHVELPKIDIEDLELFIYEIQNHK